MKQLLKKVKHFSQKYKYEHDDVVNTSTLFVNKYRFVWSEHINNQNEKHFVHQMVI